MRWLFFLGALCGCSNNFTAELLTKTTQPGGQIRLEIVNDSAVAASWSPCDQAWFIETTNGRERDPTRVYCNLSHSFPFGSSELTLLAPERVGTFFVELRVLRQTTFVTFEFGPIEVAE